MHYNRQMAAHIEHIPFPHVAANVSCSCISCVNSGVHTYIYIGVSCEADNYVD